MTMPPNWCAIYRWPRLTLPDSKMTPPFVPSGQQLFVEQECLSAARLVFCLAQRKRQRLSTLYQSVSGTRLPHRWIRRPSTKFNERVVINEHRNRARDLDDS